MIKFYRDFSEGKFSQIPDIAFALKRYIFDFNILNE